MLFVSLSGTKRGHSQDPTLDLAPDLALLKNVTEGVEGEETGCLCSWQICCCLFRPDVKNCTFQFWHFLLASDPGSVSVIETAMAIGIVTSGAPAERGIGNTGGGEGQAPQTKMINLPPRSLQWRRGRKRWTPSWPAPVGPTSHRPNCVWCRLRSLTRAGWFRFTQQF